MQCWCGDVHMHGHAEEQYAALPAYSVKPSSWFVFPALRWSARGENEVTSAIDDGPLLYTRVV
eukprot:414432-Rhodomonas_salina.3